MPNFCGGHTERQANTQTSTCTHMHAQTDSLAQTYQHPTQICTILWPASTWLKNIRLLSSLQDTVKPPLSWQSGTQGCP